MTEKHDRLHELDTGTLALFKDVAEAIAEDTCDRALTAIGLDPKNPIEAQATFAALRKIAQRWDDPATKADQDWARRTRLHSEGIVGKAVLSAVALAVLGAGHTLWAGLQALIGKGH